MTGVHLPEHLACDPSSRRETSHVSSQGKEAVFVTHDIYNKLAELQQQTQHRDPHMNSVDTIQIEAPDFDPDIDDISPTTIDQESNNPVTQGSASPTPKTAEQEIEHVAPAPSHQYPDWQETDWPDATPVEILSQTDQQNDQRINIQLT